jgi:hypothetical protein
MAIGSMTRSSEGGHRGKVTSVDAQLADCEGTHPCASIKGLRAIHRFDNANSVMICAVFLARPHPCSPPIACALSRPRQCGAYRAPLQSRNR